MLTLSKSLVHCKIYHFKCTWGWVEVSPETSWNFKKTWTCRKTCYYFTSYLYLFTFLVLILQSTCFIWTNWKRKYKQTIEQQPNRACKRAILKQKQNQATSHSNLTPILLFDLAHKQCNGIIQGCFCCLNSESKGRKEGFLSIIY